MHTCDASFKSPTGATDASVAWLALISFELVVTQMAVLSGTPTYDEIVHRRSVLTITSIASAASGVTVFVIVWMARKHQRERESVPLPLPATP